MSKEERALLEAFVVDNKDLEQLEALLAKFNIFEALGAVRQELRHSDFLSFLIDPSQNHGLDDALLKRMLKRVLIGAPDPPLSAVEIDVVDLRQVIVRREWRNIDILVHDPVNDFVCVVENKINSEEHSGQLRRYRDMATREFPNHRAIYVYLSPEGDQPSDEAFVPFSYAEVAQLIDDVRAIHESTLGPDVHTLMAHYTAMLRRHIVSDSEIAKLCRQIYNRHKQALDLIFEHRPDLQWEMAEVLQELVAEAESHGLVPDHSSKGYIRFAVADWDNFPAQRVGKGWTSSGRVLLFEFPNAHDRLQLKLIIGPGPDKVRQVAYQATSGHSDVFRKRSKRLYSKWTMVYARQILARRDYEDADFGILVDKVKAEWEKFITHDLPAIREVIERSAWASLAGDLATVE